MDTGLITWAILLAGPAVLSGGIVYSVLRYTHKRALDIRYLEGVQDGQKMETIWAVERAVEAYKLSLRRKLTDSGRRAVPRPDAQTSRIHKLRVGPPRPQRPNNQD
jgi:hypothetical protein